MLKFYLQRKLLLGRINFHTVIIKTSLSMIGEKNPYMLRFFEKNQNN